MSVIMKAEFFLSIPHWQQTKVEYHLLRSFLYEGPMEGVATGAG